MFLFSVPVNMFRDVIRALKFTRHVILGRGNVYEELLSTVGNHVTRSREPEEPRIAQVGPQAYQII